MSSNIDRLIEQLYLQIDESDEEFAQSLEREEEEDWLDELDLFESIQDELEIRMSRETAAEFLESLDAIPSWPESAEDAEIILDAYVKHLEGLMELTPEEEVFLCKYFCALGDSMTVQG